MIKSIEDINIDQFKRVWSESTAIETAEHFGCSRSTINRLVEKYELFKKKLKLPNKFSKKQKELLIGSMLGDGSLSKPINGKSTFRECHSVLQKEYLQWKNEILKPFSRELISASESAKTFPDGKVGSSKESWQCYTIGTLLFADMEKEWYLRDGNGEYVLQSNGRRIKCLPPTLTITPFSFAVWFFDDGYNNWKQRNAAISTDSFSKDDCQLLVDVIERDLGIKTNVRLTSGRDHEIYIPAASYFDCMNLIEKQKINIDCISYKFDVSECVVKQKRLSQDEVDSIFDLRENGWTFTMISEYLGISYHHARITYNHKKHRRSNV